METEKYFIEITKGLWYYSTEYSLFASSKNAVGMSVNYDERSTVSNRQICFILQFLYRLKESAILK